MSDPDIVEILRENCTGDCVNVRSIDLVPCYACEAADEIERLRQLGDTMAYFVRSGDGKEMYSAVYAWEEARRD